MKQYLSWRMPSSGILHSRLLIIISLRTIAELRDTKIWANLWVRCEKDGSHWVRVSRLTALMVREALFSFVLGCTYALQCLVSCAALVFSLSHTFLLAKSYAHVTFPYLPDNKPCYTLRIRLAWPKNVSQGSSSSPHWSKHLKLLSEH
jgi:hypothetical protein